MLRRSNTFILFGMYFFSVLYKANCEGDVEDNSEQLFSCAMFSKQKPGIQCVFSFLHAKNTFTNCIHKENNALISVGMHDFTPPFSYGNASFICTAEVHLSLKVEFNNGESQLQFTEMRPEKIFENPLNLSSYTYKMNILFPSHPVLMYFAGDVVKYTIANVNHPSEEINVLVEFHHLGGPPPACHVYNLHGKAPIIVYQDEIISLPCIYLQYPVANNSFIRLRNEQGFLAVDNSSVFYDPWEGFRLNISRFKKKIEGNYSCIGFPWCNTPEFQLIYLARENYPEDDLYLNGPKYNILKGSKEKKENVGVTLSSNRDDRQPSIIFRQFISDEDSSKPLINGSLSYNSYTTGEFMKRYFATVHVPYLTEAERNSLTGWSFGNNRSLLMLARDPDYFSWNIYFDNDNAPFNYSREYQAFICEASPLYHQYLTLSHWECNNIFQCAIVLSHCLQDNLCLTQLKKFDVPCTEVGKINANRDLSLCKATRPGKKGIVFCAVKGDMQNFKTHVLYFQGFDNELYVDAEMDKKPSVNVTLRMSTSNKMGYFWNKDYFRFRCEAHSFFYAAGIQWFLKYKNGTISFPQKHNMVYTDDEPQDKYNPESNVQFYLDDITLVQVICKAPLLHSNQWDSIFMDVNIFDLVAPKITSETMVQLKQDVSYQMMPCQAFGIPPPELTWTRNGQNVEQPIEILNEHILVFPYYNEAFLGEYICTASSVAGNISTVFTVRDVENGNKSKLSLYYTLAGLGFFAILVIAAICSVYFRMQTIKRRRQMEEVMCLVEGIETTESDVDTIDENTNPLQLPFKNSYEIQKDDFSIDWNSLLGRGEFGEVYKGTLAQSEGPIAVKMLKKNAKIEQLRALATELKILMFIGTHENLVALRGAYKQELERGILYVMVEFCGLGSLQSYLRSNKHRFLKCPQLKRGSIGEHEICEADEVVISFRSLTTLLQWCKQIACGMEYLGSKYIVHADLATRNVLLTAEGNAKVTDFGLSRRMYNYTEYIKTADDPLPWQWIAPESILLQKFSCQSDVWAYGITLWEIFSFGEIPYPTLSFTQEFVEMLKRGIRNKKPEYASEALYDIMSECWEYEPDERPTFSSLNCTLQEFVENPQQDVPDRPLDFQITINHSDGESVIEISQLEQPTMGMGYLQLGLYPYSTTSSNDTDAETYSTSSSSVTQRSERYQNVVDTDKTSMAE